MKRPITLVVTLLLAGLAAGAQDLAIPSYEELEFPPLDQVELPEIGIHTLPNGMKLYLLENHELPLIGGFALVRTGNLFDPPDKIGLASITGEVMRSGGTPELTGDEMDVRLENIAASVEAGIGETSGSVSFGCLKENIDEVLDLFKGVLTSPEFRQEKIDLSKTQYQSMISRRNDNAGGIASREFTELIYGKDTPYGWRIEYEHLGNISRDDLVAFHERYFFPENVIFAVQGDFDATEMRQKLESLFADWTVEQPPVPEFPEVQSDPEHAVYLATKEDVDQAFIRVGHLGGVLKDEDYPALEVMSDILGGGFASRLFSKVRTDLGYAYSVYSSWGANYNHPGIFQVTGSVKAEKTTETIQVVLDEIERLRTEEVTDKELTTAKDTVLNGFVFNFDSPSKTLSRLVRYAYHGYPDDFIFTYQKAIEDVTKADVLRVAKEHINPKQFLFVAVGNPEDFGEPLSALGLPVNDIDLTIPSPEAPASETSDASLAKGLELLASVQEAVGGADQLAQVKDMTLSTQVKLQLPQGAFEVTQESQWVAPTSFRQVQQLPNMTLTVFFDGQSGWLAAPQGVQPMPPPIAQQVRGALLRLPFRLWLADRQEGWTVNAVADDTIEVSDGQGQSVRLQIDPETGLPLKQTYQTVQMQGPPATVEETFNDWREVSGIRIPFHTQSTRNGSPYSDVNVSEITLNSGLDPDQLSQQP